MKINIKNYEKIQKIQNAINKIDEKIFMLKKIRKQILDKEELDQRDFYYYRNKIANECFSNNDKAYIIANYKWFKEILYKIN